MLGIVRCKTKEILINGEIRTLNNTNELLGNVNGINGVKTGFTNNAGRCLVTSCTRDDMNIITVVLGADTKKFRTADSIKIIEYAYKVYYNMDIKKYIEEVFEAWEKKQKFTIIKGIKQELDIKLEEHGYNTYPIKIGGEDDISVKFDCIRYFEAPIIKDVKIGDMKIRIEEEEIDIDILTNETIRKKEVKDYIIELMGKYVQNKKNAV